MDKKTFIMNVPVALILAVVFSILFGGWSRLTAAAPNVYMLKDGSNVYLGDVVGAAGNQGQTPTYVTYYPSIDALFQWDGPTISYGVSPSTGYYRHKDCQGALYLLPGDTATSRVGWVSFLATTTYKYDGAQGTTTTIRSQKDNNGNCSDIVAGEMSVFKMNDITLPFDPNAVVSPLQLVK
jgi:hypothetical protein